MLAGFEADIRAHEDPCLESDLGEAYASIEDLHDRIALFVFVNKLLDEATE